MHWSYVFLALIHRNDSEVNPGEYNVPRVPSVETWKEIMRKHVVHHASETSNGHNFYLPLVEGVILAALTLKRLDCFCFVLFSDMHFYGVSLMAKAMFSTVFVFVSLYVC